MPFGSLHSIARNRRTNRLTPQCSKLWNCGKCRVAPREPWGGSENTTYSDPKMALEAASLFLTRPSWLRHRPACSHSVLCEDGEQVISHLPHNYNLGPSLRPALMNTDIAKDTVLIWKFHCPRSLQDMTWNLSSWTNRSFLNTFPALL